jgi:hypothetical protein
LTSCTDGSGPSERSPSRFFSTTLSATWDDSGHWDVLCRYSVDFEKDELAPANWIVTGRFLASSYDWTFLGGDSTWVDTLSSHQPAEHSIRLAPNTMDGAWVKVELSAPIDTTSTPSYIQGHKVILLKN